VPGWDSASRDSWRAGSAVNCVTCPGTVAARNSSWSYHENGRAVLRWGLARESRDSRQLCRAKIPPLREAGRTIDHVGQNSHRGRRANIRHGLIARWREMVRRDRGSDGEQACGCSLRRNASS